jgi:threonine synthase
VTFVVHLECSSCGEQFPPNHIYGLCSVCRLPLLVRYDLAKVKQNVARGWLHNRGPGIWAYRDLLPVVREENIVTLGEGQTPLIRVRALGSSLGLDHLYIKDESLNPTGSFKARGMAVAVSMAKELGIRKVAAPSAGNAASAMAAYTAHAEIEANIFMPSNTPVANQMECKVFGANVTLIDGVISDCGLVVARCKEKEGWFDLSTLKEPYRVEGKKTMGYELAEQLGWRLPDWILYPTGGGTGLIGMWKAFDEMEAMGWIGSKRPKMVCVQCRGCAPIVKAFNEGAAKADPWPNAHTIASGLCVPVAIGDFLMLRILSQSGGMAVMVDDEELRGAIRRVGETEGVFCAPEGAACLPALERLIGKGLIRPQDEVIIFNTGAGLKYCVVN